MTPYCTIHLSPAFGSSCLLDVTLPLISHLAYFIIQTKPDQTHPVISIHSNVINTLVAHKFVTTPQKLL